MTKKFTFFTLWSVLSIVIYPLNAAETFLEKKLPLSIYIFELKPLIYQDENKKIKGAWYESFERLAARANLSFKYQFMSIPRMELLLAGPRPGCNLTFLKTKTRIEKGKVNFIYDHDIKTIFKVYQRADDMRVWDVEKIKNDKEIKIITNTSVGIEALAEKGITSVEQLLNINSIIHMLMIKRMDIFVGSNLAVEEMEEFKTKQIKESFVLKVLTHGIGCSGGTPPEVIERIKKATKGWTLDSTLAQKVSAKH